MVEKFSQPKNQTLDIFLIEVWPYQTEPVFEWRTLNPLTLWKMITLHNTSDKRTKKV